MFARFDSHISLLNRGPVYYLRRQHIDNYVDLSLVVKYTVSVAQIYYYEQNTWQFRRRKASKNNFSFFMVAVLSFSTIAPPSGILSISQCIVVYPG